MLKGIRARAAELGWDVATVSANEDKVKQINGVQDLVASGVKGILISPIDAVGVNAAYDARQAANIPDRVGRPRLDLAATRPSMWPWTKCRSAATSPNGRPRNIGGKGKIAMMLGPSGAPTFRNLARRL